MPVAPPPALVASPTDDERAWRAWNRRRKCLHEAAHGLARYLLLEAPPELLSIRPGEAYDAAAMLGAAPGHGWTGKVEDIMSVPSIAWPDALRRRLEAEICGALAGELGGMLAGWWGDDLYLREELAEEEAAETAARALATLSPRHRELLDRAEADPECVSDETSAWRRSYALTGDDRESGAHLAWMSVVTTRLRDDHLDALTRLADRLGVDEVMDTRTFLEVVRSSRCHCHSWKPPTVTERTETMSILPKRGRQPVAAYVARESAAADLGSTTFVLVAGVTRVRADHPLRRAYPGLFELSARSDLVEPQVVPPVHATGADPSIRTGTGKAAELVQMIGNPAYLYQADSPLVKRHPQLFRRVDNPYAKEI